MICLKHCLNRIHRILLRPVKNGRSQQVAVSPDLFELEVEEGAGGGYGVLEFHFLYFFHRWTQNNSTDGHRFFSQIDADVFIIQNICVHL